MSTCISVSLLSDFILEGRDLEKGYLRVTRWRLEISFQIEWMKKERNEICSELFWQIFPLPWEDGRKAAR